LGGFVRDIHHAFVGPLPISYGRRLAKLGRLI